ncbi:uncharacterized protein LOC122257278 [Penaeus japonicus]|uniref:uncharacterized protein LOC122257278 n=1 Tax=Penaeus japonicus TaxID=27405 RepID=UPI001C70D90C|nr:uncharacterized protein LOC122257278 [Penaeus japonicus]
MQPPLVVLVISAFIQSAVTSYGGATDDPIDCRIYTIGGEGTSNKTPSIPFKNNMAVSFFNGGREDNRVQTTIHLVSSSGESEPVSIFINKEAEVVLRSGNNVLGTPFSLPPPPNSTAHGPGGAWTSLVVALHDLCLVVYR